MPRFVIVAGTAPGLEAALAAAAPAQRLDLPGARLLVWPQAGDTPAVALGAAGFVIGALFRRTAGRSTPVAAIDPREADHIVRSGGRRLIEAYWGSYLAAFASSRGIEIVRSPCGELPCLFRSTASATLFFSDVVDVVHLPGLAWTLSRRRVAAALVEPRATTRSTAIIGVSELLGGERLVVPPGQPARLEQVWTAAEAAARRGPDDEASAAAALRAAVLDSVRAYADRHPRLGLLLSGGLDSSLLLAAFGAVAPGCLIAGLHHHLPDDPSTSRPAGTAALSAAVGSADEHGFAEAAARYAGLALTMAPRRVGAIDLAALDAAPLSPWPAGSAYRLDVARAEAAFADAHHLDVLVSGHAGDQVLFNGLTPLTAADHLRVRGAPGFARRLEEASRRSGLPMPHVLALAIRHGLLRRPVPRPPRFADSGGYVSASARALVGEAELVTPWEKELRALPPGKAIHVRYVATCLAFAGAQPVPGVAVVNPLHTQGVVESCLAIPTQVLTTGGVGRGLARRAFADLLAPGIAARRTKAGGAGFIQALVEANRDAIRARLLDGIAVGERLLDRHAVEAGLGPGGLRGAVEAVQVLDYLAVESWLRAWQARGAGIAG